MGDYPAFTCDVPRRCFGFTRRATTFPCGKPAIWMLEPANGQPCEFFCDEHRRPGVVPLSRTAPFRRVTLHLEVLIAAAELTPAAAHSEAVKTVLDAVALVGGVPNLVNITSTVGRIAVPQPSGAPNASQGRR